MTESNLVTKVWNYATILSQSGVSATDYVSQLTYLLFLKMDDENVSLLGGSTLIPKDCSWKKLLSVSGVELEEK